MSLALLGDKGELMSKNETVCVFMKLAVQWEGQVGQIIDPQNATLGDKRHRAERGGE